MSWFNGAIVTYSQTVELTQVDNHTYNAMISYDEAMVVRWTKGSAS